MTVLETFTDNAGAGNDGGSDWITEVSPSVSVRRSAGHVTGSLDASFRNVLYLNEGSRNSSFIALNGNGNVEVFDDSFFIDISSSISRNNLSSFRGRPQWDNQSTGSETETRYLSIAPRWVGRIGKDDTQFSVSYDGQALSYGSDLSGQSRSTLRARLFDPTAGERFGWSLDYVRSDNAYQDGNGRPNLQDNSLTGTLTYRATRQLAFRGIVGIEKNNYETGEDDNGTITGYGLQWTPTPRTSIDGTLKHHVYGNSYDVRMSHRRSLAAIDLSFTRDIATSFQTATNTVGSYYYNLFSASLVSQFPDPVQRDQATRELMKALGISTAGVFGNSVTNAFFVDQRIQAGLSLIGARHTLAFSAYRSNREALNNRVQLSPEDDFASHDNIKSWGWTVSVSHRLTPTRSLSGAFYWSSSTGAGGGPSESSRHKGVTAGYTEQLGPRTSGTVNFRHQTSSGSNEFTENSVTAALSRSF